MPSALPFCLIPVVAVCVWGLPYYVLPLEERRWSELHAWLAPSGYVGQSAGILALSMFLFLWAYSIRKRFRWLRFTGSLARWRDVHVVFGFLTPLVAAVHASWRFEGLIGVGYLAMLVVALSGVVGRYLYVQIPRRRDGLALSKEEVAARRRDLLGRLVETTGMASDQILELLRPVPTVRRGIVGTLARMIADDFARRRAVRRFAREVRKASGKRIDRSAMRSVTRFARHEMKLAQQIRILDGANRIFRLWHTAHKPFAITALLAVLVHVAVVVALGATWFL